MSEFVIWALFDSGNGSYKQVADNFDEIEIYSIGDDEIDGLPYGEIVKIAHDYIKSIGGFEKFAEWGLVR